MGRIQCFVVIQLGVEPVKAGHFFLNELQK